MTRAIESFRIAAQHQRAVEAEVRKVVASVSCGLDALARGDFDHRLREAFAPEFESLRSTFNVSLETLGKVVGEVSSSAGRVAIAAEQIGAASSDLAHRNVAQAGRQRRGQPRSTWKCPCNAGDKRKPGWRDPAERIAGARRGGAGRHCRRRGRRCCSCPGKVLQRHREDREPDRRNCLPDESPRAQCWRESSPRGRGRQGLCCRCQRGQVSGATCRRCCCRHQDRDCRFRRRDSLLRAPGRPNRRGARADRGRHGHGG
jgi:hypothetical protein